jgi:putative peptidoglycan lipid II flippase
MRRKALAVRPETFLRSVGSAVVWKGLDRAAGLAKHVLVAAALGLSASLDVFYMASALLGLLVFSWANLIDVVAVPSLVRAHRGGCVDEFRELAGGMLVIAAITSVTIGSLLYVFRFQIADIAVGFDASRKNALADAFIWLMPVAVLFIPLRLMGAVLRATRVFSASYQGECLTAFVVLICVAAFRFEAHVLLWSLSAGVAATFLFLFFRSKAYEFGWQSPLSPRVRDAFRLAPGLFVLQVSQYVYVLTDRIFVSHLAPGAISALAYALTLTSILPTVAALSGSFITVLAERDSIEDRAVPLNSLISFAILVGALSTCFLASTAGPLVTLLLQRGVFSGEDTAKVATAIYAYSGMVIPLLLIIPLEQVFQVEAKIGLIVRRMLAGIVTNLALNLAFLAAGWGIFGVALATTASYWVMLVSALYSLRNLGYPIPFSRHLQWLFCIVAPQIFAQGLAHLWIPNSAGALVALLASTTATLLAVGITVFTCRGEERALLRGTLQRLITRRSAASTASHPRPHEEVLQVKEPSS